MSSQILDRDIEYAYIKKQPDPWGLRAYYYNCTREGGDSGWLRNNLDEMEHPLASYSMTAEWTFDGKWDPEKVLRDLGRIVAY